MLGTLEEVLARDDTSAEVARSLTVAHRNSQRLLRLVNSLLDFSRLEAGRVKASYRPTDLGALTTDLVSNFRAACDKAGLTLRVDCPPLPRSVFVDRDMWEKIVLNLVSNAFKFTLSGEIHIRLSTTDTACEMSVSDSGVGIPEAFLPHIFERFHRVPTTQKGGPTRARALDSPWCASWCTSTAVRCASRAHLARGPPSPFPSRSDRTIFRRSRSTAPQAACVRDPWPLRMWKKPSVGCRALRIFLPSVRASLQGFRL